MYFTHPLGLHSPATTSGRIGSKPTPNLRGVSIRRPSRRRRWGGTEGGRPTERPRKLYKIGELIERSGISRQTLHNYTMLGLIEPTSRTPSGHRLYGEESFELLERIKQLRKSHTLMEIKELLGRRRGGER